MMLLRVYTSKILIVICLLFISFLYFYMFLKLQEDEDEVLSCNRCRALGFKSVGKDFNLENVVTESVLGIFEMSIYVKQVDMIENGISVVQQDQFALRGLTELSSIRKTADNIFFVETSCVVGSSLQPSQEDEEEFTLDARQACAVESAARANPERPVYLLHSCPLADDFALRVPPHARALLELHNVFVVILDLAEMSEGWPDPLPFTSTSLGLLALWQYGGTYCHLDTLVLRPLLPLGVNYCGYQDDDLPVQDGVLNFEPLGYGHQVVTQLLSHLSENIDKSFWQRESYLTQVVVDQCSQLPETEDECDRLTIYDSTVLFDLELSDVDEDINNDIVEDVKKTAYTVSYLSRLYLLEDEDSDQKVFLTLAKEFCPVVYTRSNRTF